MLLFIFLYNCLLGLFQKKKIMVNWTAQYIIKHELIKIRTFFHYIIHLKILLQMYEWSWKKKLKLLPSFSLFSAIVLGPLRTIKFDFPMIFTNEDVKHFFESVTCICYSKKPNLPKHTTRTFKFIS